MMCGTGEGASGPGVGQASNPEEAASDSAVSRGRAKGTNQAGVSPGKAAMGATSMAHAPNSIARGNAGRYGYSPVAPGALPSAPANVRSGLTPTGMALSRASQPRSHLTRAGITALGQTAPMSATTGPMGGAWGTGAAAADASSPMGMAAGEISGGSNAENATGESDGPGAIGRIARAFDPFAGPTAKALKAGNIPAAATFGLAMNAVPLVGMVGTIGNALGAKTAPDGTMPASNDTNAGGLMESPVVAAAQANPTPRDARSQRQQEIARALLRPGYTRPGEIKTGKFSDSRLRGIF